MLELALEAVTFIPKTIVKSLALVYFHWLVPIANPIGKAMFDYFIMGMTSAVLSFVGGILATNQHWSDFLTDLSFIILYIILGVCATSVLWNSLRWSSKHPLSVVATVFTVGAAASVMALMHKNQLFHGMLEHAKVMGPLSRDYLHSWWDPAAAKVAHAVHEAKHHVHL